MQCESSHTVKEALHTATTMCRQNLTRKRHACFNLALLINVAEPAPFHAKSPIHSKRDQSKNPGGHREKLR
jgi:hypothetical protein